MSALQRRFGLARGDIRRTRRGKMKWRNLHKTLFLVLVLGHDGEVCFDCGWHYQISMWAPSPLWHELAWKDGGGLLCARCLNKRAKAAGIWLDFTPMVRARRAPDGTQVPTTNWWLSDTRDWLMMGWLDPDTWERDRNDNGIYPTQWPWKAIKDQFADLTAPPVNLAYAKPEAVPAKPAASPQAQT